MAEKRRTYKTRIGLYVQEKREDGGYYQMIGYPVSIGPNGWEQQYRAECIDNNRPIDSYQSIHDETIRNASNRHDHPTLYLENLRVDSLGNSSDHPRVLFGWETRYHDVYSIDAHKAERMHKTLTAIYRHMGRHNQKFGEPKTFGQYLARVADAIGADAFVFSKSAMPSGWYSRDEHAIVDIRDGIYRTDRMIQTWINAGQPAAVAQD